VIGSERAAVAAGATTQRASAIRYEGGRAPTRTVSPVLVRSALYGPVDTIAMAREAAKEQP
jgi:hypothetical protein